MISQTNELVQRALALSEEDRAELANLLIESLDEDLAFNPEYEREIERRVADVDGGRAKRIPWAEAKRRIFGEGDGPTP